MLDIAFWICGAAIAAALAALFFLAYEVGFKAGVALKKENDVLRAEIETRKADRNTLLAMKAQAQTFASPSPLQAVVDNMPPSKKTTRRKKST